MVGLGVGVGVGVGVGAGIGAGICLELEPEPEISKMDGSGNCGFRSILLYTVVFYSVFLFS